MAKKKRRKDQCTTDIRPDILQAIHKAFPDDFVAWSYDAGDCYVDQVSSQLQMKLRQPGVQLLYQGGAQQNNGWSSSADDDDDWHEAPPGGGDLAYSYRTLFFGLTDEEFQTTYDDSIMDENGDEREIEMVQHIGCVVSLSQLGRVAIIRFGSYAYSEESDDQTIPDIGDHLLTEDGPVDVEQHLREGYGLEAFAALQALREQITKILEQSRVVVIPDEEGRKPVPWLSADEEVWMEAQSKDGPITVKDAFFFRGP